MRSKPRRGQDHVGLMEAIYDLSTSSGDWLSNVSRAVTRDLQAPLGAITIRHVRRPDGSYVSEPLFVDTPPEVADMLAMVMPPVDEPRSAIFRRMVGEQFAGLLETFPPGHPYRELCVAQLRRFGARDTNLLVAFDTAADVVSISAFFGNEATPTRQLRVKYRRIAAHLASAIRLRRHLEAARTAEADAVFDPRAKSCDARGEATGRAAQQALREAVRARESARAQLTAGGSAEALGLWTALVSGRWSLLDRFDSDGRRFIVAVENQNVPKDPRALTPREEQIAQLAGCGAPNGQIAYAMGTTPESVSSQLTSALRKLGCKSRRDLIRMMNPSNYEFALDLKGGVIGVIVEPKLPSRQPESLTPAERRVLELLRRGNTNAEIAKACARSLRTVANQVASILRKTGAHSRYELMREGAGSP